MLMILCSWWERSVERNAVYIDRRTTVSGLHSDRGLYNLRKYSRLERDYPCHCRRASREHVDGFRAQTMERESRMYRFLGNIEPRR